MIRAPGKFLAVNYKGKVGKPAVARMFKIRLYKLFMIELTKALCVWWLESLC